MTRDEWLQVQTDSKLVQVSSWWQSVELQQLPEFMLSYLILRAQQLILTLRSQQPQITPCTLHLNPPASVPRPLITYCAKKWCFLSAFNLLPRNFTECLTSLVLSQGTKLSQHSFLSTFVCTIPYFKYNYHSLF